MMTAYHAQLNSADEETRLRAAKAWSKWEYVTLSLVYPADDDRSPGWRRRSCTSTLRSSRMPRTILGRSGFCHSVARARGTYGNFSAFARIENHYFVNDVSTCVECAIRIADPAGLRRVSCAMASCWISRRLTRCR